MAQNFRNRWPQNYRNRHPTDGRRVDLRGAAQRGAAVLEFGPGRFELDASAWGDRREDVEELEIRGAGKEQTTIVAVTSDLLYFAKAARHVRIHDLTFDGGGGGEMLLNLRGQGAVIVERVRFLSWASGGHGGAIGVTGGAYLGLRDCEFLGGRRENSGSCAVSLRGNSVVLATSCVFADVSGALHGWLGSTTASRVTMADCTFLASPVAGHVAGEDGRPWFPITVRGGRALLGPEALDAAERAKRWGLGFVASGADTVAFGPDPAILTVGDLLRVAEEFRPAPEAVPYAIEVLALPRLDLPAQLRVETSDRLRGERSWRIEVPSGSSPSVPGSASHRAPSGEQLQAAGSLAQAARRSTLPMSQPARSLVLEEASVLVEGRYEQRFTVTVLDDRRVLVAWIDARTGETIPSPWR